MNFSAPDRLRSMTKAKKLENFIRLTYNRMIGLTPPRQSAELYPVAAFSKMVCQGIPAPLPLAAGCHQGCARGEDRTHKPFNRARKEHPVRRAEKEIRDRSELEQIIRASSLCRLAMCAADRPYLVPLSFGYRDGILYFHSAPAGRKIDILRQNDRVCFEFAVDCRVSKSGDVCNWGVVYRSVIGSGRAFFIEELQAKRKALAIIVEHYGGSGENLPEKAVHGTLVFAVRIAEMTGKQSLD